ncbi:MAG: GMC family oxidoreductase, partial [Acidobacteria bacterium]|nr:GMC family oxidoreductase [Acidobacteriota bacterium]
QFQFGANDRALFNDIVVSAHRIFDALGTELKLFQTPNIGGFASHEVGTIRMGRDPKTSVLNEWNQTREVRNLFVVDGSCFTTFPEKNPTLTIAALAVRCARHIARQRRQGAL